MINKEFTQVSRQRLEKVAELTAIASPTGYTYDIMEHLQQQFSDKDIPTTLTPKGGLLVTMKGQDDKRQRFVTAHVDTLGAIVREIKGNGRLKLDLIGGFLYNAIEGEYCTVHVASNQSKISGTILMHQTSVHVYKDARTAERNQDNMEVRLDMPVENEEDVRELGIDVGDFISFEPRIEITDSGFIKSRHLDDKVSAAILIEMIEKIHNNELELGHTTHFYFSNNEEIGYGGNSNIPAEVEEYLAVDMGALGDGQQSDEFTVSICVKDASGPYHYQMRQELVALCQEKDIEYKLDIYPFYMSDATGAMRAGYDVRHALIGAGIDSSHAFERTHFTSVDHTADLIQAYLESSMK